MGNNCKASDCVTDRTSGGQAPARSLTNQYPARTDLDVRPPMKDSPKHRNLTLNTDPESPLREPSSRMVRGTMANVSPMSARYLGLVTETKSMHHSNGSPRNKEIVAQLQAGFIEGRKLVASTKGKSRVALPEILLEDGNVYLGAWSNEKMDGQGTLSYPDGSQFIGEWRDGVVQGMI